jgi:hypothetical protein
VSENRVVRNIFRHIKYVSNLGYQAYITRSFVISKSHFCSEDGEMWKNTMWLVCV